MRYVKLLKWMNTGWVLFAILSIVDSVLEDSPEAGVRSMLLSLIGLTITTGFLALLAMMRKPSVSVQTYGGGGGVGHAGITTIGSSAGGSGHPTGITVVTGHGGSITTAAGGGGGNVPKMAAQAAVEDWRTG